MSGTAEPSPLEGLLLEVVGVRFLSYLLNVNPESVTRRIETGESLGDPAEAVIQELTLFVAGQPQTDPKQFSLYLSLGTLGKFVPELKMGWATAMRVHSGGSLDLPEGDTELATALIELMRDVYPLLLLPEPTDRQFAFMVVPSLVAPIFSHPARERFEQAALADVDLSKLVPDENPGAGRHGNVYTSAGRGGTVQLSMLPEALEESSRPVDWVLPLITRRLPDPAAAVAR